MPETVSVMNTYKIMYDSNNIVRSITTDVSALCPLNASVTELDVLPDGVNIDGGWYYQDGEVLPVPVDYVAKAEAERQRLLMTAQDITSGWVTTLALGILSDEERKTESLAHLREIAAGDGFQHYY